MKNSILFISILGLTLSVNAQKNQLPPIHSDSTTLNNPISIIIPTTITPSLPVSSTVVTTSPPTSTVKQATISDIIVSQDSIVEVIAVQLRGLTRDNLTVKLYDSAGTLLQENMIYQGSTITFFDSRTLYAGNYTIRIMGEGRIWVKKIHLNK